MGVLRNIIKDNKFTPEDIPAFEAKLFFEGDKRRINLERYIVALPGCSHFHLRCYW
jgi:hypothetical protein